MNKIYQKTESDCQRCCIAILLNKKYEDVPDFMDGINKDTINVEQADLFDQRLDNYLKQNGLYRIDYKVTFNDGIYSIPYVSTTIKAIGVLKKEERMYSHAVIIEIGPNNISVVFDPKINSEYNLKDITHVEFVCSLINF